METGIVKRFNKIKGYGFIASDKNDDEVFVHFSQIQSTRYKELQAGQRVSYTLEKGERGEFASNVQIISE